LKKASAKKKTAKLNKKSNNKKSIKNLKKEIKKINKSLKKEIKKTNKTIKKDNKKPRKPKISEKEKEKQNHALYLKIKAQRIREKRLALSKKILKNSPNKSQLKKLLVRITYYKKNKRILYEKKYIFIMRCNNIKYNCLLLFY
jgi:hypothetical protein